MKALLSRLLFPVAWMNARLFTRFWRIWSHASFAARIQDSLDSSVVILGPPEVHGTGNIRCGRNLYLYRELYLETNGEGAISIGDDVVISRGTHIVAFDSVEIGAGTMIGEYCSVRDANHVFGGDTDLRKAGHKASPITIGRNVWIGRGVTILSGVEIGEGAIVGANSVVTRSVLSGAVVVGAPARQLYTHGLQGAA